MVEIKLTKVQQQRIQNLLRSIQGMQEQLTQLYGFLAPEDGNWDVDLARLDEGVILYSKGEQNGEESKKSIDKGNDHSGRTHRPDSGGSAGAGGQEAGGDSESEGVPW